MSSFPFTNLSNFPLSEFPYNSRTELAEAIGNKNYISVGFKPGFPLQASELNEVQDIFALNQNLTTSMINWWQSNDLGNPSVDTNIPKIYGPGWLGTTPLWPEAFENQILGPTTNLFSYTENASQITIKAKVGWYLVYSRESNLKHWIKLGTELQRTITPLTSDNYIGFYVYYRSINSGNDGSLNDNSTLPTSSPGADRIQLNIDTASGLISNTNYNIEPTNTLIDGVSYIRSFSPIARANSNFINVPLRYMNNRNVPKDS